MARENAVALTRPNMPLAIRNAFGRVLMIGHPSRHNRYQISLACRISARQVPSDLGIRRIAASWQEMRHVDLPEWASYMRRL